MNEKGCEWMNRFWRRTWSVLLAGILGVTTVGTVYGKETEQKSSSEQSIIQQYTNHRAIVQVQEGTQLSYPSCNVEALGEGYYCISIMAPFKSLRLSVSFTIGILEAAFISTLVPGSFRPSSIS